MCSHRRELRTSGPRGGGAAMTAIAPQPIISRPSPVHVARKGSRLSNILRTTDHKTIGLMYLTASFVFFIIGGLMAMLMRAELAQPGLQFLSPEQYNQLFTMHGTLMLLMFATPLFFAFGNLIMPLQIGVPGCGVPAAERAVVLAVPLRQHDRDGRVLHPRRGGGLRLDGLHPAVRHREHPRRRPRTCGSPAWPSVVWARSSAASTSSPRSSACGRPA